METRGGLYEELAIAYSRRCFEPLFASPFRDHTRVRARSGDRDRLDEAGDVQEERAISCRLPEGMVFMNRLQFGFYSVLARLDVQVDYAAVERAFMSGRAARSELKFR